MLEKLRDQTNRWYFKVLFSLLVVCFGIWGVADIFVNYVNMRPVATVDGRPITQEEFSARLQAMAAKAQELSKGQLAAEQIKDMGIPQKILDSLIDQALLAADLKKRRLVATDAAVRNRIQTIPAFLNEQGAFDKRAFDYLLHNNHMTEGQFIADIRTDLQQQQLFGALMSGLELPKSYINCLFQGFFEQRVFAVATIPLAKMVVKDVPEDKELEKFYHQNQAQFTVPEMRSATLLVIDPVQLKNQIILTPAQVQEEYGRRKAEFEIAEKREVKQVNCKDEETAKKAVESLKKGRPVPAVARDFSAEFKDLGLATKQQTPELVADRLFEADLGQVIGPVSTPFGWQVYVVSKIEPSFTKSYQEMRASLEADLKTNLANDQIYELKNKVEDALAGGATLGEVAKEHQLKVQEVKSVSKSGKDRSEKDILPETGKAELLDQIFSLAEKSDSSVLDTKEGVSYVVHVDAVQMAHVPAFKDIKDKVSKEWLHNKRFELGIIVAQQLAKDVRSVSDLSRLALGRKLPIKMLDPLSRADSEKDEKIHKQFTPRLVSQMFELAPGKATFGVNPDRDAVQVVMLQKVLPFNPKSLQEKWEHMAKKLSELVHQDASLLYIKSLRAKASITVNQGIYDALVNRG